MVKRKIILLFVLLAIAVLLTVAFRYSTGFTLFYSRNVFVPLQSIRGYLLIGIPLSVGDVLYVVAGVVLLITISKWVWYLRNGKAARKHLTISFLNTVTAVVVGYLWFVIGWGGNYYKPPMRQVWHLDTITDTVQLETFDSMLVTRMNDLAPLYGRVSVRDREIMAIQNLHLFTDVRIAGESIRVKYSAFSYFLQRMAIEGYYNPFTSEGQITDRLPDFMRPFIMNHEMAHQAGVASESDANLVAYAVGSASPYAVYRYSAALNLWLYVDARLSRRDSVAAQKWERRLNKLTQAHLDTLEKLSELYDNDASRYGAQLYDGYLKMQQQKDGIKSYGGVTGDAWRLELMRQRGTLPARLHLQ